MKSIDILLVEDNKDDIVFTLEALDEGKIRKSISVLKQIKSNPETKYIPVIMLTTSSSEVDVISSFIIHANCYITKPVDTNSFLEVVSIIEEFWISIVQLPSKS